jgi:hypothetical protein
MQTSEATHLRVEEPGTTAATHGHNSNPDTLRASTHNTSPSLERGSTTTIDALAPHIADTPQEGQEGAEVVHRTVSRLGTGRRSQTSMQG